MKDEEPLAMGVETYVEPTVLKYFEKCNFADCKV